MLVYMKTNATPPFFNRISSKISLSFLIVVIFSGIAFYFINRDFSQKMLEQIMKKELESTKTSFENLQKNDTTILMSTLAAIKQDPAIRKTYLSKDREKLYEYVSPLFAELRDNYNITHWYFILPDGTTFLRVHQKDLYGDAINRSTFIKSRDTQGPAAGIELGKTAYALRAVVPYYDEDGTLIGYLELASGVDHLLSILKKETNNEFTIIADKKYLNREDWRSVRETSGLRDSWNDIGEKYLSLGSTIEDGIDSPCFSEENIEKAEKGENVFQHIQDKKEVYQCIGFVFDNVSGQHSSSIFALLNVTDHVVFLTQTQRTVLGALALLLAASVLVGWAISRYLSQPIKRLSRIAEVIASGDFDVRADIVTNDEVGQLSRNFNVMTDKLIEVRKYPEGIIRSMADNLVLVGNDGNIKEVNQATLDLLGYTKEELLGGSVEKIIAPASGAGTDPAGALMNRIFAETKMSGVCTMEDTFKTKDGTYIPMSVSCSIMRGENHAVVGMVMVAKDVRAAHAAEEKLKASEQRLRVANQGLEDSQRQLEVKIAELEKFNKLVVGRELKMAELKKENEELKRKLEGGGTQG